MIRSEKITGFLLQKSRVTALALASSLAILSAGCSSISDFTSNAELQHARVNEHEVLRQTNAWRAQHGMKPLKLDKHLNEVSQDMADHIARRDSLDTPRHSASSLMRRTAANDYKSSAGAENLGAGYANISAVMHGWKTSADHNKNLLNPHVTHLGVARTNRPDGTYRNFWVMTLAAPRPIEAPKPAESSATKTAQTTLSINGMKVR
ncbi:CAP domain-containing protein [Rhodobacteraceae bacterium RKSG542]|uniref:CAP domain-containing protein n=1 Tax=Pseudovibrio flavus TaxID=2529854 RepID=UPI0012BC4649|nr:CAP domain-containing protein [Pseudovibrio flavus]MTI17326.1 CAP domain-containing protein [Pseudovibrio flavus]